MLAFNVLIKGNENASVFFNYVLRAFVFFLPSSFARRHDTVLRQDSTGHSTNLSNIKNWSCLLAMHV